MKHWVCLGSQRHDDAIKHHWLWWIFCCFFHVTIPPKSQIGRSRFLLLEFCNSLFWEVRSPGTYWAKTTSRGRHTMHDEDKVFLFMRNPHDLHRLTLNEYLFDEITMFYINFCILPPFSKMKVCGKEKLPFLNCVLIRWEGGNNICEDKKEGWGFFIFLFYYYYYYIYSSGVCVMK